MLLHQPDLPFFAITGDYYPLSSTPSTLNQTQLPGALFALPLPTTVLQNHQIALKRFSYPDRLSQIHSRNQSPEPPALIHSYSPYPNPPTPSTNTMPRQSLPKVNPDTESGIFPAPPLPVVAGGKRGASAVSGNAAVPALPSTGSQLDANDQSPLRLPPKLKEAERMMHVQRWVNHLPGPMTDSNPNGLLIYWGYSNMPGYRHIEEDRELTPPPSRTYLSRLPFTPEEEQTMLRFFSNSSEFRNQHPTAVAHDPYADNPHHFPFHSQRTAALHQATANHHLSITAHQTNQGVLGTGDLDVPHGDQDVNPTVQRRFDQDATGTSRFFAEWEIRLISHLFHEYFPGRPEPMGHCGVLPSVSEVRSRIASSRLKETRTATAIRAKIKRMQSSGTWIEYP